MLVIELRNAVLAVWISVTAAWVWARSVAAWEVRDGGVQLRLTRGDRAADHGAGVAAGSAGPTGSTTGTNGATGATSGGQRGRFRPVRRAASRPPSTTQRQKFAGANVSEYYFYSLPVFPRASANHLPLLYGRPYSSSTAQTTRQAIYLLPSSCERSSLESMQVGNFSSSAMRLTATNIPEPS